MPVEARAMENATAASEAVAAVDDVHEGDMFSTTEAN